MFDLVLNTSLLILLLLSYLFHVLFVRDLARNQEGTLIYLTKNSQFTLLLGTKSLRVVVSVELNLG